MLKTLNLSLFLIDNNFVYVPAISFWNWIILNSLLQTPVVILYSGFPQQWRNWSNALIMAWIRVSDLLWELSRHYSIIHANATSKRWSVSPPSESWRISSFRKETTFSCLNSGMHPGLWSDWLWELNRNNHYSMHTTNPTSNYHAFKQCQSAHY
jgi:hypothetical protein